MKTLIKQIEKIAKKILDDGYSCHDWDHTERVRTNALKIAKQEKADLAVIEVAALLHDIKKKEEMDNGGQTCHALEGAKEAEKILKKLKVSSDFIEAIKHCIQAHRFRNNIEAQTLEAKILSDADKIDGLGAIGLGRAWMWSARYGARLHNSEIKDILSTKPDSKEDTMYREFMDKFRYLEKKMYTKTGRKIARERIQFMRWFIDRLDKEIAGKL